MSCCPNCTAAERRERARAAAYARWSKTSPDQRRAALAEVRSGQDARIVARIDPDRRMSPDEQAAAVRRERARQLADARRRSLRARRERGRR